MNFKDIVNREIVNLANCENEPIHIPGSIQPHGFLLAINVETNRIDFCSGNTADYIKQEYKSILGKSLLDAFGEEIAAKINAHISTENLSESLLLQLEIGESQFQFTIHNNGTHFVLEGEPTTGQNDLSDLYGQTMQFVSYMSNTNTLQELCQLVANGTRDITGYDRVMIYRFDKEYNGEVFAESCRDDIEPFLGLHYPHTDIPPQARDLYMRNLLRLIADINYSPVPVYTIDDGSEKNLDLSIAILRSTSPIHVEYLQNMGVGATLTISLIHRGRLWGLIACHHYSQKNLSPEIRLAAQLQGQFITSQIDVRQSNEEYKISRNTNIALEKINAFNLPPVYESFKILSMSPDLLKICNASGVSILVSGNVYANGITPSQKDIPALSEWLFEYSNDGNFFTDKISNFVSDMKQVCESVSGIIYHSLGNGNSIIWYRPESQTEINWGGDPNKAIIKDSNGLHPRNSFQLWKQVVKNRSNDWLQPELNAAANYAHALQKQIGLLLLSQEEEKYRSLSEVLRETNAELENINWISTHDLQEPLRKIQLISSRLLTKEDENHSETTVDSLNRMNNSANRMQTLLHDILKYTRIQHTEDAFENVDLNLLMKDVLDEVREIARENSAEIEITDLPLIYGIPFLLKQLFSNIILNSIKYASAERTPVIKIDAFPEPENSENRRNVLFHVIRFSDNGIGFEPQYAESIFNIFTRLHGHLEYKGSGVGLALCKKIMQTHDGTITAKGSEGSGATFIMRFPNNHIVR